MGLESMAILLRGGGVLIMLVCVSGVHFPPPLPGVPNWQGCTDNVSLSLPYCDPSLSIDQRVDWLVANLTLVEQIAMISPQIELGDGCGVHTRGKPSIGLPNYFWLTEANTAVAASCYTADPTDPYRCATTFVGPMNMGASFNRSSWRAKGNVLGTELRAFNNLGWNRAREENYIGLTGFGPNINIARDPRFGRVSEVPSEDPIHSGVYGAEMISGMQTQDEAGHPKMIAYLKHFTAYSREQDRMHSEANISTFDLFDTYLPQYELAFQANASGVMCSYDSINGNTIWSQVQDALTDITKADHYSHSVAACPILFFHTRAIAIPQPRISFVHALSTIRVRWLGMKWLCYTAPFPTKFVRTLEIHTLYLQNA